MSFFLFLFTQYSGASFDLTPVFIDIPNINENFLPHNFQKSETSAVPQEHLFKEIVKSGKKAYCKNRYFHDSGNVAWMSICRKRVSS